VEEGETGGGAVVVHVEELRAVAADPVATNSIPTSTPHPWTTATVRPWLPTITAHACACGPVVPARAATARAILRRYLLEKTTTPRYSRSSTTFSFKRRFKKPRVSST